MPERPEVAWSAAGACDCHTHVFLDERDHPFAAERHYTPPPASVESLQALHASLGIERVVVVQPSVYGSDNRATLAAQTVIGPDRARGVAVIDPGSIDDAELDALHAAGVRGVRINLIFAADEPADGAAKQLQRTVERIAPWGWHVQVFAGLSMLAACHGTLAALPVPVVLDHYAGVQPGRGVDAQELIAVLSLVESGRAYVKLSAPYRCSNAPGYADLMPLARRFVQANPERMLWGSDWPHPQPGAARSAADISPPFVVDNAAVLQILHEAIDDAAAWRQLLVDNPERLYGFGR